MEEWIYEYRSRLLELGTSWRWMVSFTLSKLHPLGKSPPGTHWIKGWVGPRAGLYDVEK
jgi:hypothetical protein